MRITLACDLKINALSVKELKKVINDKISELVPALTSGLSFYSESARYAEDSLEILDIENVGNGDYSMSYRYKWTLFNACLDINAEEFISDSVRFSVTERGVVFDIIDNSRPSTADEL
ncbi:Uncharacterised protein [Serratia ficaria]|uniref:hypothetical protein n=1 Tax=Serratia ficaria TaxID=61651 RepID=UPI0021785FCD|nr:hypothetical protein [Serratia ficaria]CAI1012744.1 Uncharacterised protein [Serratia ficaria]CAI1995734.1 Uncharacterised protein [Serratia ficaria]CAI2083679.1 Uncharacterised protein [Serratia ficaria]CAI2493346.1 Uncharacterised protein [Serratia ficaria]